MWSVVYYNHRIQASVFRVLPQVIYSSHTRSYSCHCQECHFLFSHSYLTFTFKCIDKSFFMLIMHFTWHLLSMSHCTYKEIYKMEACKNIMNETRLGISISVCRLSAWKSDRSLFTEMELWFAKMWLCSNVDN